MKPEQIIQQLDCNRLVFQALFAQKEESQIRWKPDENSWSLLEIICHLYDEEREDFRIRVISTLSTPELHPPSIDPTGWVIQRKYIEQDYSEKLASFLEERKQSVRALTELKNPIWDNIYHHPNLGGISAYQFLANWLAHDYHHIRQVNRRLYEYLKTYSLMPLEYAGDW